MTKEEFVSHVERDQWKVRQCVDLFSELAEAHAESGQRSAASAAVIKESGENRIDGVQSSSQLSIFRAWFWG